MLVVCRQASDYLKPGFVRRHTCKICDKPLQMSVRALGAVQAGAIPLCNPCGFRVAEKLQEQGLIACTIFSPEAREHIATIVEEMAAKN